MVNLFHIFGSLRNTYCLTEWRTSQRKISFVHNWHPTGTPKATLLDTVHW